VNENIISILRGVRTVLQTVAEPVDWAARVLNNKKGYPPLRLRQQVGDLSDFEGSGGEYLAYLKLLCDLKPGDKVLDIGCGCGLITLDVAGAGGLLEYLGSDGRYVGIDVNEKLVRWCNKNIGSKYPIAQFSLPKPLARLFEYKFDVVLCKSLFTHLLLGEAKDYLRLIRGELAPGGRCLATFFLIRDIDRKLEGRYKFRYPSCNGHVYYERDTNPKLAVAYDESLLASLLQKLGFSSEVWYGTWRDNRSGLSFQDIIIMRRQ